MQLLLTSHISTKQNSNRGFISSIDYWSRFLFLISPVSSRSRTKRRLPLYSLTPRIITIQPVHQQQCQASSRHPPAQPPSETSPSSSAPPPASSASDSAPTPKPHLPQSPPPKSRTSTPSPQHGGTPTAPPASSTS